MRVSPRYRYLFWIELDTTCSPSARASRLSQSALVLGPHAHQQSPPRVDASAPASAAAAAADAAESSSGSLGGGEGAGLGAGAASRSSCSLRVKRAELDGANANVVLELPSEQLLGPGLFCKKMSPEECARLFSSSASSSSQPLVELVVDHSRQLLFLHFQLSSALLAFDYTGTTLTLYTTNSFPVVTLNHQHHTNEPYYSYSLFVSA